MMIESNVFLISSFDPKPKNYLHGLAFSAEDLIIGNDGYEKYRSLRKKTAKPGQDGAYIIVEATDNEIVVGTDYSGYYKLFLYQNGNAWALSNSLLDLASFAASRGLPVTINESHLASFFIKGAFGNQLVSLQTSVNEIRLIPSSMEVVITQSPSGDRIALQQTSAVSQVLESFDNYSDALREYLRLWTGRMATVLQSDLFVHSDLTGGRDSRAILALMLAASEHIGRDGLEKISFRSGESAKEDFAVATHIAGKFNIRIGGKRDRRSPARIGLSESYQKWKSLCLGVYMPVYFPATRPVPSAIAFSGAGGEGHRRFYPNLDPAVFLERQRRYIPSKAHFEKLKQDVLADLAFLARGPETSVDPMVLHYRHFRDRCHGGRSPQYGNTLSPLASGVLRKASSLCSSQHIDRGQVLADILINANRELATMPYDSPRKSFDPDHFADLVDASEAIRSASKDGRVFAGETSFQEPGDFSQPDALRLLREDFLSHYDEMRRSGFFPKEYIDDARSMIVGSAETGRLSHAIEGCAVAHVILAGELSRLGSWNAKRSISLLDRLRMAVLWR